MACAREVPPPHKLYKTMHISNKILLNLSKIAHHKEIAWIKLSHLSVSDIKQRYQESWFKKRFTSNKIKAKTLNIIKF